MQSHSMGDGPRESSYLPLRFCETNAIVASRQGVLRMQRRRRPETCAKTTPCDLGRVSPKAKAKETSAMLALPDGLSAAQTHHGEWLIKNSGTAERPNISSRAANSGALVLG